jgi:hypothetical protein
MMRVLRGLIHENLDLDRALEQLGPGAGA